MEKDIDSGTPTGRKRPFVRPAGIMAALAVSLAFSHAVSATTDSAETSTAAEETTSGSDYDAEEMVERLIEEWYEGPKGRGFRERGDLNVVHGTALTALNANDKRWPKARTLAFQVAFTQAMGEYVNSVRQRVSVKQTRDYFSEDVPESELRYQEGEAPDSYVGRIVGKIAALSEHVLDQKLAESGMDRDELRSLTPTQKKTTLSDRISRNTLIEAVGSAAGLVPVKTFESVDTEGNSAVGVVAVFSERVRQIANQISKGEVIRPDPHRARNSIESQIFEYGKDELPNEFGARVLWDEQGYPAIVSFGQWGWSPSGLSKRKRSQSRKFARKQAGNDARSNLTVFVNASASFTEESNVGTSIEEGFNLPRGGVPEEIEDAEVMDMLVQRARIDARVDLTGYTTAREWKARHPLLEEHEIVGVVAYWSPAREDAIRKTIGKEAKHAPPAPPEASQESPKMQASGSTEGRDPDLSDF